MFIMRGIAMAAMLVGVSACGEVAHEAQPVRIECTLELADGSAHYYENEYGHFDYREGISQLITWENGLNAADGYRMIFIVPESLLSGPGRFPWGERSLSFNVGWSMGRSTLPRSGELRLSQVGWLAEDEWHGTFDALEMTAGEDISEEHRVVAVRNGTLYALVP